MPWRVAVQAFVLVVVLVVLLLAQAILMRKVARLRSRVGRAERAQGEVSRAVATVQGWAEQQFRAVRGEFTVARVNDSADRVLELRARKHQASAEPEDTRDTNAAQDPCPIYALRPTVMRPPAPLAYPDLIGAEDIAEEAAHPHLGPDEKTPPRRGRAAMLVASYPESEKGGAA
jgi:hypothetical protein